MTKDVFVFYLEYVKPLYCEIEARDNTLPVELLFEIHAAFDHLRRHHVDGEDEKQSANRAIGHLKRGALDAFKLKLKYFHDDVEHLLKGNIDLTLVDSGKFLPNLLADKDKIVQQAKKARLKESASDPTEAFEKWSETSLAIDNFFDTYLANSDKITWAKKATLTFTNKNTLMGIAIGLATGIISSLVVWWLTKN